MNKYQIIETIANLPKDAQNAVYENMKKNGLGEAEIENIQAMVFFHKLYNDADFYNAVVETVGNRLYDRLNA